MTRIFFSSESLPRIGIFSHQNGVFEFAKLPSMSTFMIQRTILLVYSFFCILWVFFDRTLPHFHTLCGIVRWFTMVLVDINTLRLGTGCLPRELLVSMVGSVAWRCFVGCLLYVLHGLHSSYSIGHV